MLLISINQLLIMDPPPESITINRLVPIPGTPLEDKGEINPLEIIRTIASIRILIPTSVIRLSAGRETMSKELQSMCFAAGANSIFSGEKLLTTPNADEKEDEALFQELGLEPLKC